mmetsp:Transcript_10514/g.24392  ORF Transcript_10514/g.24392 Transcript_10514/m.24392 type:complete len:143 (+) Transcript_10514:432-860(+)
MLLDEFGWRIAEMVDRLTRDRPDGSRLSVVEILNNAHERHDTEVLLIKLFDRVHNMRTLDTKDEYEKTEKSHETFDAFIVYAMSIENKYIEQVLYELCCKYLSITTISNANRELSYLPYLKSTDTHLFVSQVFQNATHQLES